MSVCPAIPYGWAHIKSFEREKFKNLKKCHGNYEGKMTIPSYLKDDFSWWSKNISSGKMTLQERHYNFCIYTDASDSC